MKKISLYIVAAAMALTSCSDWLQEEPQSFNDGTIRTEADAIGRVNYLNRTGAPTFYSSTGAYAGGTESYNIFLSGYYSSSYQGQELAVKYTRELTRQQQTNTISNDYCSGIWTSCYRAINVANTAIASIGQVNTTKADNLIAQAQFFRAFNYYYLVKTFGDVPLYTEPTEGLENANQPRVDKAEIYKLIEADLTEAINHLPAGAMHNNGMQVTKPVAQTLLGEVLMRQGKNSEATKYFKAVIDCGAYALLQNDDLGANSYINKLRTQDNTSEAVYAYEFDRSISTMNRRTGNAFSGSMAAVAGGLGIYELVIAPTEDYCAIYNPQTDLRIQNQQFFATEVKDITVDGKGNKFTWTWDGETRGDWFYCQESTLVDGIGDKDWNIFRYTEVLLSYAECAGKAEGAKYLAQIMARADMTGKAASEYEAELSRLSDDQFKEACWTERIKEFPLEYKIWEMIVRTQKYPVINGADDVTYVNLVGAKTASGATVKDSDLLWPVPLQEIQRNPSLTQNPGY